VLVQNEPAMRLYESLGFERVCVLEVWSLARPPRLVR
jgi:ribosomal protein S18 acetylase RimI-like enzyme